MSTEMSGQHPPNGSLHEYTRRYQRTFVLVSRLCSPWLGYVAAPLLVAAMLLVDKADQSVPYAPIFIGAPFALVSILVSFLWGLGPALLAIVMGLVAIALFISPGILIPNIGLDILLVGPFVIIQLIVVVIMVQFKAARQRLQGFTRALEATNRKLIEANEQLERANSLKDYVITRSSHELRTPMTTILGRTQLVLARLKQAEKTPEQWSAFVQHLEIIKVQALRLRALIDDLFDLSSVHSGKLPLRLTLCDLGSLCRDVIENQHTLSGRSIELELPPRPIILQADNERLSQVLVNLVNNAVKYSPEKSTIHMHAHQEDGEVILQISNECPTLSQVQLEHFFEPFYRSPEVEYSPIEGWGLGLSISKELIERHGGQIWAELAEGKGITFFIKLPFQAGD